MAGVGDLVAEVYLDVLGVIKTLFSFESGWFNGIISPLLSCSVQKLAEQFVLSWQRHVDFPCLIACERCYC